MTTKTPTDIANEIVSSLNKDGTIKFAGLDRAPDQNELTRAIVRRAIEADRAQREPAYDSAELQAALDRDEHGELNEIVDYFHTYLFDLETDGKW